jgi:hypothetical protein
MAKNPTASFSVVYQYDGFDPSVFATFKRTEKLAAYDCLRRLAHRSNWECTTFTLRRERKAIVRIRVSECHLPRGHEVRRFREQFRAELSRNQTCGVAR